MTVFTDGDGGTSREQEAIVREVQRSQVIMNPLLKKEIYRSIDQFFHSDKSFYQTYDILTSAAFCYMDLLETERRR